jgi:hypothetical protein
MTPLCMRSNKQQTLRLEHKEAHLRRQENPAP